MKRLPVIFFLFFTGVCTAVHPQYPIPSYNVCVQKVASFLENGPHTPTVKPSVTDEQRVMVVKVKAKPKQFATIWVYSLDNQDFLGPYSVFGGETLYVPIDDRLWGVIVQCDEEIEVDVFIAVEADGLSGDEFLHDLLHDARKSGTGNRDILI